MRKSGYKNYKCRISYLWGVATRKSDLVTRKFYLEFHKLFVNKCIWSQFAMFLSQNLNTTIQSEILINKPIIDPQNIHSLTRPI